MSFVHVIRFRRASLFFVLATMFLQGPDPAAAADPPAEKGVVRMVFAGDMMLDGGPGHFIAHGGDPLADAAAVFADADLAVANLECVIATAGQAVYKDYCFLAKPSCVPVLKRHLAAVCIANNHACDYGKEGLVSQLDLFDKAKLPYFGGGRNAHEARHPLLLQRNGRRVALLGYCGISHRSAAGPKEAGVAWMEQQDMLADIKAARAVHHADFVVVFLHWGTEESPAPKESQRGLARALVDAGADAVIGNHPHVTQTIDLYRGRPIVYSLGNFIFDYFPKDPAVWNGWIVELTFGKSTGLELKTYTVELDAAGVPHLLPKPPAKPR
jgi:poly-gamma-glutamate capsule biosynthesis protein CapA/YwtB (metallophosphatase superfamily)